MVTAPLRTGMPLLLAALVVGACGDDAAGPSRLEELLEEVRAATAPFKDVNAALAAGYENTAFCVLAEDEARPASEGAMGIHFVHPALLGITQVQPKFDGNEPTIDLLRPEILLYEPQPDGSLVLVGVEYMVFADAWRAAGNTTAPRFATQEFNFMEDDPRTQFDEAHGFEGHFEQHVWTERANPRGLFEFFNPNVSCAAVRG